MLDWPSNDEPAPEICNSLCKPIRLALNQVVSVKRGVADKLVTWSGPKDIPCVAAVSVSPDVALSDMKFRDNRRIDGMDVVDIIILLAVQLGIEQGRRLERCGL